MKPSLFFGGRASFGDASELSSKFLGMRFTLVLLVSAAWGWSACTATSAPPEGVVRIDPEHFPRSVPGPFPNLGPFESRGDALLAACPRFLSQRGATAGRKDAMNFNVQWRVSTEYCAWIYYTPDDRYELSMLVESGKTSSPDEQGERRCEMPAFVDDPRYPQRSLKYVYIVHNHPAYPTELSEIDISALVRAAKIHGGFLETKQGRIPLGIVAFFSSVYEPAAPSCDGFLEYNLERRTEVVKWTRDDQGHWRQGKAGTVTWLDETTFRLEN
jgi:hypothetical protein